MNMKKILCYIVLASAGAGLAGCYEDKSTYATDQIPDIVLTDVTTTTLYMGYLEQIDFAPELTQDGKVLDDSYHYTWELNDVPDGNEFEVIGTERELHVSVPNGISTQPYLLKLTVEDPQNGLEYLFWWDLYIQSAFLDGLLVSDTKDGTTSDLTLVLNEKLTTNYAGEEEKIFRNILAESNGSPYPGLLSSLTPMLKGYIYSSPTHYIWAIDQEGAPVRFNCVDYSYATGSDVLLYQYEGQRFCKFLGASNNPACQMIFVAMTTAGNYGFGTINSDSFALPNALMTGAMKNGICASRSYSNTSECVAVWLDEETNHLIAGDMNAMSGSLTYNTISGSGAYDADNLGDQEVIAGGMTYTESIPALLLKDNASGEYAIYTVTPHQAEVGHYTDPDNWEGWVVDTPEVPYGPRAKIDIPAEGKALLDQATGVTFCTMQAILYVATESGIYAIDFTSGTAVVSEAKFTPDDGERITSVELYQQGQYKYCSAMCSKDGSTYRQLLDWTNSAVIVTTQKSDTEGFVYVVPMVQIGTGNLDKGQALKYDGFGKILDVTTSGY